MSQLSSFIVQVAEYRRQHPELREGQSAFNALLEHHPSVAEAIRGGGADPFYDNDRLVTFWQLVGEELDL